MAGYIGNNPSDSSVRIARQIYTTSGITSDFTFTSGYDPGYIDIYVNGERQTEGTNFTASDGQTFTIMNGGVSTGSTVEASAYKTFNVATVTLGEVTDVDDLVITGQLTSGSIIVGSAVTANLSGLNVSGVVTATSFSGDGSALTGLASTDIINAEQVNVSGSTTTGIATVSTSIVVGSAVTVTATAININPTVTTTIGDSGNVDFNDDAKARFGTGNDLSIYHSGAHSFINDSGTGNLKILSSQVDILNPASNETIATFAENGAVSLYYDNSVKLATTNDGTVTTGIATATDFFVNTVAAKGLKNTATGQRLIQQASNETRIYHASNAQVKLTFRGTGDTYRGAVNADANGMALLTGAASEEYGILCVADGATNLYYNASKKFETTNDGVKITGITTCSNGLDTVGMLRESFNTVANKLSAAPNIDVYQGMVHYFTTTETTTATPNLRYTGSQALNDFMSAGDAITVTIITNAAAAGFSANWEIDGTGITEEWVGGSAPTAGGSDGYDIYTANVLKIGDADWKVFINLVNAT